MNTEDFLFSASSFKEYLQCGLKFKYHRIDKIPPTTIASHHRWFGLLVHSLIYVSIAHYRGGKSLELRETSAGQEALDLFDRVWDVRGEGNEVASFVLKEIGDKPIGHFFPGKIKSLGYNDSFTQEQLESGWRAEAYKMIKNGIDVVSNIPEIVELEKKLVWTFANKRFIGYADIVSKDENGKIEFYDLKTSWNRPGKYLAKDFQFFSYSFALKQLLNLDYYPKGYFVHLKSGVPLPIETDQTACDNMTKLAETTFSYIENNLFFNSYGSPLCKFCDFRHMCYAEDETWQ